MIGELWVCQDLLGKLQPILVLFLLVAFLQKKKQISEWCYQFIHSVQQLSVQNPHKKQQPQMHDFRSPKPHINLDSGYQDQNAESSTSKDID